MALAVQDVRVYLWDWPPLREILSKALPFFLDFDEKSASQCRFSSLVLALRSDDEFNPVKVILEKCYTDFVVNLSHASATIARQVSNIVRQRGGSYLEAQLVKIGSSDALLLSTTRGIPEILDNALRSLSSNIVELASPPGSLIVLKWLLLLLSRGVLRTEDFASLAEALSVRRQSLERLLRELGFAEAVSRELR